MPRSCCRRALAALAAALLSATALAQAPPPAPSFAVRYRTAGNVYLDGGSARGLRPGDRLAVMAGDQTLALLEVDFLAENSASCRIVSETRTVRPGDIAVLLRAAAPAETVTPEPQPPPAGEVVVQPPETASGSGLVFAPPRPLARVRGGLSLGYYRVWDESPASYDFEQRTGRLDLSAWEIGGLPLSFNARLRSRQDVRSRPLSVVGGSASERVDRLYELSLRYEPPEGRVAVEAGRLGSSHFVGIGYLDGALVRLRLAGPVHLGGFYGQRAEVDGLGFEGDGAKYGGFVSVIPSGRFARSSAEGLLAFVREFDGPEISREYVALETRFGTGARLLFFQRGELDLNRGWRREAAESAYQVSNLSLSASLRLSPTVATTLSYDSRRNYRNHLNRSVPEALFDDYLHEGFRANLSVSRPRSLSFVAGGGLRLPDAPGSSRSWSWNAGLRHDGLFRGGMFASVDGSGFLNQYTEGYLLAVRTGWRFARGHQVDLGWGASRYRLSAGGELRQGQWIRLVGRAELLWRLYLSGDVEYDWGDDLQGPRAFLEAGWLF